MAFSAKKEDKSKLLKKLQKKTEKILKFYLTFEVGIGIIYKSLVIGDNVGA